MFLLTDPSKQKKQTKYRSTDFAQGQSSRPSKQKNTGP